MRKHEAEPCLLGQTQRSGCRHVAVYAVQGGALPVILDSQKALTWLLHALDAGPGKVAGGA